MFACDSSCEDIRTSAINCLFGELILIGDVDFAGDTLIRRIEGGGMDAVSSSQISKGVESLGSETFCGEGEEPKSARSGIWGDITTAGWNEAPEAIRRCSSGRSVMNGELGSSSSQWISSLCVLVWTLPYAILWLGRSNKEFEVMFSEWPAYFAFKAEGERGERVMLADPP